MLGSLSRTLIAMKLQMPKIDLGNSWNFIAKYYWRL